MCQKNKIVLAAAGSGKTTYLVNEALNNKTAKILITTFTNANEESIKRKFVEKNKCVPDNVSVQGWFTFLLRHGARPFQGCKYEKDINGLLLVNSQSAPKTLEYDTEKHYFTKNRMIYSDKLSKFVIKCNELSEGSVIDRLSKIYSHIYIDEVQDLAGYDLDFLKLLCDSKINILLVGDPRQGTFSTNNSIKNKNYAKSNIEKYFEDKLINIKKDDTSLLINYRSGPEICALSNLLFPGYKSTKSGNNENTGHDGVFIVKPEDVGDYLNEYGEVQLCWDRRTKVNSCYPAKNFGDSKGLEYERVLIYPTEPFINWLKNNDKDLAPISRSKFYVALTRAKYSVGIVLDYDKNMEIKGVRKYK